MSSQPTHDASSSSSSSSLPSSPTPPPGISIAAPATAARLIVDAPESLVPSIAARGEADNLTEWLKSNLPNIRKYQTDQPQQQQVNTIPVAAPVPAIAKVVGAPIVASPALPVGASSSSSSSSSLSSASAPPPSSSSSSVATTAATSEALVDDSPSSAPPAPVPARAGRRWRVALGVLSAAKAGLKLAPVVVDGTLSLASSGTESVTYYARRSVEASSTALRGGITRAGEAAATRLETWADTATDEEAQAKYARWSQNARWTSGVLDRGLETGSDVVEKHVLAAVNTFAQSSLAMTALTLKTSMRGTKVLVAAADVGTKYMLARRGFDVDELTAEHEHESMVDCVLSIMAEVKRLNSHLKDVGTAEMITVLRTYSRLISTVESQHMFKSRRQVLPELLATISAERKKSRRQYEQDSKEDPMPPPNQSLPELPPTGASAAAPPPRKGWLAGWWGWATNKKDETTSITKSTSSSSHQTELESESDPESEPVPSPTYEDGLYALASGGMTKVSRAMLFAGAAYGPRFLRFMGLPTNAQSHEAFIVEQSGIDTADILLADFTSSLKHPGFALLRDSKFRQIVLVIRGSSAIHDALTDLTCGFTKHVSGTFGSKGYAEGYCHEGMYQSAQWFAKNMRQPILDALRAHPDYTFTLTGHSLGGGVGSLLFLLWLHDPEMNPTSRRIRGEFFGSPCVVSPELAHLGYGYINNWVLGDDVVCRLSKGAVEDLCSIVLQLTHHSRQETALYKLPSKERRQKRAELAAYEKKKSEEDEAKGIKRAQLHPACQDHKELAKLLDEYDKLIEQKKSIEAATTSGDNSESLASASSSSSSSSVAPEHLASAQLELAQLESAITTTLDALREILAHLRKSMVHDKLFQVGHIFHLLPQEENETSKEKEEVEKAKKDADKASEEKKKSSSASSTKDPSKDPNSFWYVKKKISSSARLHMSALHQLIGMRARDLPSVQEWKKEEEEANKEQAVAAAAAANAANVSASSSSPPSSAPMSVSPAPSESSSSFSAAVASRSSRPLPVLPIAPPVALSPAPAPASSRSSSGASSKDVRKSMPPVALPVARPVSNPPSKPSTPNSVPTSTGTTPNAPTHQDEHENDVEMKDANSEEEEKKSLPVDMNVDSSSFVTPLPAPVALPAPTPSSASPLQSITPSSYTPPIASAISLPRLVPERTVFTHPPPFALYCGHWSDLTDLTFSSQMIQHHTPAAYFVALATHATTREQAKGEKHQSQLEQEDETMEPTPSSTH